MLMAALLVLGGSGIYLVCSLLGERAPAVVDGRYRPVATKEAATMTEGQPAAASVKKVGFRSLAPQYFDTDFGRNVPAVLRKKPNRRVTWCGGRIALENTVDFPPFMEKAGADTALLEDEVLKSILKKVAASPGVAVSPAARAGGLSYHHCHAPSRRVTWCGGRVVHPQLDQSRDIRSQEL
jgi:hypothetical protein